MTQVRFIANSMEQALHAARRELGPQMQVVHAATRRDGWPWPLGRVVEVELIAQGNPEATRGAGQMPWRPTELRLRLAARLALARAVETARHAAASAAEEADQVMLQAASAQRHGTPQVVPALVERLGARLRAQGLDEELAGQVTARVAEELASGARTEEAEYLFTRAVADLLPVAEGRDMPVARAEGRPRVLAVVGPTGVGKTTTVAKLAADLRMRLGLRVGIVAADAYRVGAVDQLHAYAQILGAPMRAADSPGAMRTAMLDLGWCDVVLVDTAGRSHRDTARIAEVGAMLNAARPDETHLVLSGTGSVQALREAALAFQRAQPTRVVLSKLDECEAPGALVQAVRDSGCPASWFTTGQEVPDDIERADPQQLARRIVQMAMRDEGAEDPE